MSNIFHSFEFYEALKGIITNLPENEVISGVIKFKVDELPTIEVTQYLKTADGDLAIEDREAMRQSRKFKIVPIGEE